ncbi:hypothetical protein K402DRAFT_208508 [Aulographum hederae CBS 113979]|uniref:Uncharacterized protein n=1 Tax=Aulographum hederae CBS 113979 TaxID=1176131 RepID=A0A6G1GMH8_9PEZI|nr:hypothetical protein K402DRAFT_208508 [Aulographum hederae CBS 113979]
MDGKWNLTRNLATAIPSKAGNHARQSESCRDAPDATRSILRNVVAIQRLTGDLRACPYDPNLWCTRSKALYELDFPELAIGDAYKALKLCEKGMAYTDLKLEGNVRSTPDPPPLGRRIFDAIRARCSHENRDTSRSQREELVNKELQLLHRTSIFYLHKALLQAWCLTDAGRYGEMALIAGRTADERRRQAGEQVDNELTKWLKMVQQSVDHWKDVEAQRKNPPTATGRIDDPSLGHITRRSYPWMDSYLERDTSLLQSIQREFDNAAAELGIEAHTCVLRRVRYNRNWEGLGVFAGRNICKNEDVLLDASTLIAICDFDGGVQRVPELRSLRPILWGHPCRIPYLLLRRLIL